MYDYNSSYITLHLLILFNQLQCVWRVLPCNTLYYFSYHFFNKHTFQNCIILFSYDNKLKDYTSKNSCNPCNFTIYSIFTTTNIAKINLLVYLQHLPLPDRNHVGRQASDYTKRPDSSSRWQGWWWLSVYSSNIKLTLSLPRTFWYYFAIWLYFIHPMYFRQFYNTFTVTNFSSEWSATEYNGTLLQWPCSKLPSRLLLQALELRRLIFSLSITLSSSLSILTLQFLLTMTIR